MVKFYIKANLNQVSMKNFEKNLLTIVIFTGNLFSAIGFIGILGGLTGLLNLDSFSFGLSSGIRVVGTFAIAGCLLNAIGYGIIDHGKNNF
jgi:hypothetical protein